MQALTQYYVHSNLQKRLLMGICAAVLLNAVYCLAYRYASGNPATMFEALSWGVINIAPWVAAIELGRSLNRAFHLCLLFLGAAILSLCLEMAVRVDLPTTFDLVRRIPGAIIALTALGALKLFSKRNKPMEVRKSSSFLLNSCDWVRSAGNYVEIHIQGCEPNLVRATLSHVTKQAEPKLVQIHRRYAVLPKAIDQIEHKHVRLRDGTRLPVGDRYRDQLSAIKAFIPSSQNH